MRRADHEALAQYVLDVAARMGLRDWTLSISREPADDDNLAECSPTFGQRRATLRFSGDVREWTRDRVRRVVVHELLHCHTDRADTMFRAVADELAPQARTVAGRAWDSVHEDAVDDIATAWAESMPLISWPAKDTA